MLDMSDDVCLDDRRCVDTDVASSDVAPIVDDTDEEEEEEDDDITDFGSAEAELVDFFVTCVYGGGCEQSTLGSSKYTISPAHIQASGIAGIMASVKILISRIS